MNIWNHLFISGQSEVLLMLDLIAEMLSMPFIIRALIVGVLVSLCAALLGVYLVLKRCSMIGDGLSHVGFGTVALALALNITPLYISIPLILLAAFLLLRLNINAKIKGDAAIALVSSSSLAIGIFILSITKGISVDINFATSIGIKLILDILNEGNDGYIPRLLNNLTQYTLVCNTSDPNIGGEMVEIFSYPLQVTTSLKVGFSKKCGKKCKYEQ